MNKRTALVTGASRGIGRSIALSLAENGWQVVLNYHRSQSAAEEVLAAIRQAGGEAIAVQADISLGSDRARLLQTAEEVYGFIDLLVNNAGIAPQERTDLLDLGEASYDHVMAVNLKGPFFLSQLASRRWLESIAAGETRKPMMININSISAYTSSPDRAQYCLSKAGMGMMTALFADRLAEAGISVFEIRPGIIATDMTSGVKEKYDALFAAGLTPLKRWGQPEDVARAVVALAGGALPYATGEVINIDGGFHLRRL